MGRGGKVAVLINRRIREVTRDEIKPLRIERKLVHGQMVDVKIYPTMHPLTDLEDYAAWLGATTEDGTLTIEDIMNTNSEPCNEEPDDED